MLTVASTKHHARHGDTIKRGRERERASKIPLNVVIDKRPARSNIVGLAYLLSIAMYASTKMSPQAPHEGRVSSDNQPTNQTINQSDNP
jgi:hypothetical protein